MNHNIKKAKQEGYSPNARAFGIPSSSSSVSDEKLEERWESFHAFAFFLSGLSGVL